ncbi:MAG: hypothetical protein PWP58_1244 [Bacillota bacterium]|jgi:hypothetical protein|nr:hypothetical protein [Bacillota bacterium]MDK2784933.1 hypothetical protein [Bacillota bacterium]MDK2882908.1 hypothetical protein [Bacillota bacterium]
MEVDENALVEKIVAEVLRRLAARGKRALALFCGGSIGAPEGRAEVKKLQDAGFTVKAVLTPSAEWVLGKDWLRSELGDIEIVTEADRKAPSALLKDTDITLVPVLTLNTAAKVAHGIANTLVATLIMDSLLTGRPVFAARDACDLANPVRAKLGMDKAAPAYRALLAGNLDRLAEFGIRLVGVTELAAAVLGEGGRTDAASKGTAGTFTGRVLSRTDVAAFEGSVLRVSAGTLITPLARDLARDRGIEIVVG